MRLRAPVAPSGMPLGRLAAALLLGALAISLACHPLPPRGARDRAASCSALSPDSLGAELSALGARARAAGERGDLNTLRALSDSVDSLRRAAARRCPSDSAAAR